MSDAQIERKSLSEPSDIPMPSSVLVMRSKKEAIEYIQKRYPWMSTYSIGNPETIWKFAIDILFIK